MITENEVLSAYVTHFQHFQKEYVSLINETAFEYLIRCTSLLAEEMPRLSPYLESPENRALIARNKALALFIQKRAMRLRSRDLVEGRESKNF